MKKFSIIQIAILFSFAVNAQDVSFLNPDQSRVYLNPSFSGSDGDFRLQSTYRMEGVNSGIRSGVFNFCTDGYVKALHGGLSASLLGDETLGGTSRTTWLSIAYAPVLYAAKGKLKLTPSVQGSYFVSSFDRNQLHIGDPLDARRSFVWNDIHTLPPARKENVNLSAGLLSDYRHIQLGVAAFNINQPDIGPVGEFHLPIRWCTHSSYWFQLKENSKLKFSVVCNVQKDTRTNLWLYSSFFRKNFFATIGACSLNAMMAGIGYQYHNLRFTYNLENNFNRPGRITGHEISLGIYFSGKPPGSS